MVFCSNVACKNNAGLPVGHKNEFPLSRKWKTGDINQIMLLHCRSKHQAEFDAINSQAIASVDKAASTQSDVRIMLKKNSIVMFEEAKLFKRELELNKEIVYNFVVHDKLFRRAGEVTVLTKYKMSHLGSNF